jgi:hypothetical protein
MLYEQPAGRKILSPDKPNRKVLVALEIFDPLSQTLVSSGLVVTAKGLGRPVVSYSGRFVWLDEGGAWPQEISVQPVGLPFEGAVAQPPKPANLTNAKAGQRLVRIVLRPTAAADFSDVTAVRGQLAESRVAGAAPVQGATAQLAWFDKATNVWIPSPEQSGVTNGDGEFAAFLRLLPTMEQEADFQGRFLKVRVQFTRGNATRATPENYAFLPNPNPAGRVVEGELLARDLKLGWTDLQQV